MINIRNVIIAFIGFVLIILVMIFNYKTKSYFINKTRTDNNLQELKSYELKLNYDVLKSSLFSKNLDNIKNDDIKIKYLLNVLENDSNIKDDKQLYNEFMEYKKFVLSKIVGVYKFKKYSMSFKNINDKSIAMLEKIHKDFLEQSNKKLTVITVVSFLLIIFILFVVVLILYLFYRVDKENKSLEKLSMIDNLTGLYNKRKFQEDVKNIQNPILLIVDIDRFKYCNDVYGIEAGDFILKEIANTLRILLSKIDANIYKLSSDDFGILVTKDKINVEKLSQAIINYFKNNIIEFNDLEFNISINIGVSEFEPLIETTDIALKEVKQTLDKHYEIYNPKMNSKYNIEDNFDESSIEKNDIENDDLILGLQPIFDDKTGEVIKYELL